MQKSGSERLGGALPRTGEKLSIEDWLVAQWMTVSSSREFLCPALDCGCKERFYPPFQAHCLMTALSLEQRCGLQSLTYTGGSECHRSDASQHRHRLGGTKGYGYFQSLGLRVT